MLTCYWDIIIHVSNSLFRNTSLLNFDKAQTFWFWSSGFLPLCLYGIVLPVVPGCALSFLGILLPSVQGSALSSCPFALWALSLTGSWRHLAQTQRVCVLPLTFPDSSSACQPLPGLEGAKHSFVHQMFYFCSYWIFQFSRCIPGQRLPKLLFNKSCPPNSPSQCELRVCNGNRNDLRQNSGTVWAWLALLTCVLWIWEDPWHWEDPSPHSKLKCKEIIFSLGRDAHPHARWQSSSCSPPHRSLLFSRILKILYKGVKSAPQSLDLGWVWDFLPQREYDKVTKCDSL